MNDAFVKIKEIEFNSGDIFHFKDDNIVVFVGANNVGKSKHLKKFAINCKKRISFFIYKVDIVNINII